MKHFFKKSSASVGKVLLAVTLGAFVWITPAVSATKTLVVGTDITAPPFAFSEDGKYVGFDMDLWKEIADRLDLKYTVKAVGFDALIPGLQTKMFDVVINGVVIRDDRKKVVDFSIPYYVSGISILTKKESNITEMSDLTGKTVTLRIGTTPTIWLKDNVPGVKLKLFQTLDSSLLDVLAGGSDAAVYDTPILQYLSKKLGTDKVKVTGNVSTGQNFGIVYQKGSDLVEPVNNTLRTMKKDGTFDRLYQKWFNESAPENLLK